MVFTDLINLRQIEKGLELQNDVAILKKSVDQLSSLTHKIEVIKVTGNESQTVFALSGKPADDKVILLVKGVNYMEGIAFTVDRDAKTITWTATEADGGFGISDDWVTHIIAIYKELKDNNDEDDNWGEELVDPDCFERYSGNTEMVTAPKLNTGKITNMKSMFSGCGKLTDIPKYNTSNVTDMMHMFAACDSLKTIPQLDTSNVTNMRGMFSGDKALEVVPSLDTSKAENILEMFLGCTSLKTVGQLDFSSVSGGQYAFQDCSSLVNISFVPNSISPRTELDLSDSPLLSKESLLSILNGLNNSAGRIVMLHADSKALLTAEELAIATNKGWTIQ